MIGITKIDNFISILFKTVIFCVMILEINLYTE